MDDADLNNPPSAEDLAYYLPIIERDTFSRREIDRITREHVQVIRHSSLASEEEKAERERRYQEALQPQLDHTRMGMWYYHDLDSYVLKEETWSTLLDLDVRRCLPRLHAPEPVTFWLGGLDGE